MSWFVGAARGRRGGQGEGTPEVGLIVGGGREIEGSPWGVGPPGGVGVAEGDEVGRPGRALVCAVGAGVGAVVPVVAGVPAGAMRLVGLAPGVREIARTAAAVHRQAAPAMAAPTRRR